MYFLSLSLTLTKTLPDRGSLTPAPSWALAKALPNSMSMPMTSPVDFISGPSRVSTPGNLTKGKTDSLTEMCLGTMSLVNAEFLQGLAGHHPGGDLGQGPPGGLGNEGDGAAGPGVDLEQVDGVVLDRELDVHQADDLQFQGQGHGLAADLLDQLRPSGRRAAGRRPSRRSGCRPPRCAA